MKATELKERAEKLNLKVWESGEKVRIYVKRNEREQAGYVTYTKNDTRGTEATDEWNGLYVQPTRAGNQSTLRNAIDELLAVEIEVEEIENDTKVSKVVLKNNEIIELGNEPTGFFRNGFFFSYDGIEKISQNEVVEWFDEVGISNIEKA